MNVVAVVQARMSSTRLPGKVLAEVEGEPMLALLLKRLSRAREVDQIVVATSDELGDDPIEEVAAATGHRVHRGPLMDVLTRFLGAAPDSDAIVRITADCPFTDPGIVDRVVKLFRDTPGLAYASNVFPRTFPDGLDVEVVATAALDELSRETTDAAAREHVTTAVHSDPERFPQRHVVNGEDLGDLRWTVDTPADLEYVRALAARLGERRYEAGFEELLAAAGS